jgi:hypothetical protein
MTKVPFDSIMPSRSAHVAKQGGASGVPLPSVFRWFLHHLFCILVCLPAGAVLAQVGTGEEPPAEGGDKAPPQAMIRAFVVPGADSKQSLQIVVKPQKADADLEPQVVAATDGPAVFSGSYQATAPGAALIELRAGDKVLAKVAGSLRPARAYTFVAWQTPPSGWQIKAFPDDPASPNAADRALRILNFPAGRETLLSIDRGAETKVPGNVVQEIQAPAKVVVASVKVLALDGGPPALSSLEMDLTSSGHGYVVVVPDNLGRMRPRFIGGGYEAVKELEPSPARVSAPVAPLTAQDVRKQRIGTAQMELDNQQTILNMINAREARMGAKASATLLENKREAEKKLAELRKNLEAARSATPAPAPTVPGSAPNSTQ